MYRAAGYTVRPSESISTLNTLWSSQGSSIVGTSRSGTPNTIYSQPSLSSIRTATSTTTHRRQKPLPPIPPSELNQHEQPGRFDHERILEHLHAHNSPPQRQPFAIVPALFPAIASESRTADKKATNPFACPYCSETFTKSSDRKKHFNYRCKSLGDGSPTWECLVCGHLARSESQIKDHQKKAGHPRSGCDEVDLPVKPRFTCSDDGIIYRGAEDFLGHFAHGRQCKLNQFHAHGNHFHHARLHTLLQEGRDDVSGHRYIYAELMAYCHFHDIPNAVWEEALLSHPEDASHHFATKLEWGLVEDDGTALSRLGFTDLRQVVHEIMSSVLSSTIELDDGSSLLPKETPVTARPLDHSSGYAGQTATVQHHQQAFYDFDARYSEQERDYGSAQWCGAGEPDQGGLNPLLDNAFPIIDKAPQPMAMSYNGYGQTIDPELKRFEYSAPYVLHSSMEGEHWPLSRSKTRHVQDETTANGYEYDAQPMHSEPTNRKAKRPISEASRILPEEVARVNQPHSAAPAFRFRPHRSDSQLSVDTPPMPISQRSSSGSTSVFFNFSKYYSDKSPAQPANLPLSTSSEAVYLLQGAPVPAPSAYYSTSPATCPPSSSPPLSLTSKAKAYIQSLPSASLRNGVREIDEVSAQDAFGRRPALATGETDDSGGAGRELRCLHCRREDCYSGHIGCQPAVRKARRSGGVYSLRASGEWRMEG